MNKRFAVTVAECPFISPIIPLHYCAAGTCESLLTHRSNFEVEKCLYTALDRH